MLEVCFSVHPNIQYRTTLGVYGLLQKKVKVSWVLVILTSLGIIGALFGIFVV